MWEASSSVEAEMWGEGNCDCEGKSLAVGKMVARVGARSRKKIKRGTRQDVQLQISCLSDPSLKETREGIRTPGSAGIRSPYLVEETIFKWLTDSES